MADQDLSDKIAAAAEDVEGGLDVEVDWVRHQEPPKSPSAVYSVRIPVDRIEELRELASARGVPPTTLIRTWVLAQLDAAKEPDEYVRRWEQEVRTTTDRLRTLLDERPGSPLADAS